MGHIAWNKNKKTPEETKEKQRQAKLKNPVRYWLGKKRPDPSKETRLKISLALKGVKHSAEHNAKVKANNARYWKGKKKLQSEISKKKISQTLMGHIHSKETRDKIGKSGIGKHIGELSGTWKGGITPINNIIRGSLEYKLWSDSVWNRDGNCCQKCGDDRVSKLVAHHILNFAIFIELRFAIDNGITLCRPCHKEFHHRYGNRKNNREQLQEFLT